MRLDLGPADLAGSIRYLGLGPDERFGASSARAGLRRQATILNYIALSDAAWYASNPEAAIHAADRFWAIIGGGALYSSLPASLAGVNGCAAWSLQAPCGCGHRLWTRRYYDEPADGAQGRRRAVDGARPKPAVACPPWSRLLPPAPRWSALISVQCLEPKFTQSFLAVLGWRRSRFRHRNFDNGASADGERRCGGVFAKEASCAIGKH